MKVLLVSPLPPPIGGIASWTVNVLNFLSHKNYDFDVIHQNTALRYRSILGNGILSRLFWGIIESKRIIAELKKNILIWEPNVIHITSSASLALIKDILLLKIAQSFSIPVIVHWRFGRIPELAREKNWEWKLLCQIVRKSKTSIVIDEKSLITLLDAGLKNVVKIPNPLGLDAMNAIVPEVLGRDIKKVNQLIYVGHVSIKKGIYELVETCTKLSFVKELKIIGPYESKIFHELVQISKKRENGIWLKFLGGVSKSKVLEEMQASKVLILPSYSEGFPNVIIEAMAMGCAVIATDVGAIPEMLAADSLKPCGICIPPRSKEKLKEAIISLLNDNNKIDSMGKNGVERVLDHYSMEKVMDQYETIWENATKQVPI